MDESPLPPPSEPPSEPRDQMLSIRLTRAEKRRLNVAKGQEPLEKWSRDRLLAAAAEKDKE